MSRNLDPNIQSEKQITKLVKGNEILQGKPRIGQGRAGMRRKPPFNQTIAQSAEPSKASKIEKKVIYQPHFTTPVQSISNSSAEVINRRPIQKINKNIPFYPDPTYRPPLKLVRIPISESPENIDINLELNTDLGENSPFQEGVILKTYQRPDK